jgi:hypothetical protein
MYQQVRTAVIMRDAAIALEDMQKAHAVPVHNQAVSLLG